MANPTIRRYGTSISTSNSTLVNSVPTGRALVISKLLIVGQATCNVTIYFGGFPICNALPLASGQVWSESGLTLLQNETITGMSTATNTAYLLVFGEEIDN